MNTLFVSEKVEGFVCGEWAALVQTSIGVTLGMKVPPMILNVTLEPTSIIAAFCIALVPGGSSRMLNLPVSVQLILCLGLVFAICITAISPHSANAVNVALVLLQSGLDLGGVRT